MYYMARGGYLITGFVSNSVTSYTPMASVTVSLNLADFPDSTVSVTTTDEDGLFFLHDSLSYMRSVVF